MRKASKMKQKPETIQVYMNINGNVYYECSLESRNLRKELLWVRPLSNLKKPKKKSKAHESSQDQEEEDDDPFQIYSAPTAVNPSTYITDMLNNLYDQFMDKYQY